MSSQGIFSHVERANLDPEFIRAMEEVMNFDSEDDDDDDVWDEPEADYEGADKSPDGLLRPPPGVAHVRDREYRHSTGSSANMEGKPTQDTVRMRTFSSDSLRPRSGTGPDLGRTTIKEIQTTNSSPRLPRVHFNIPSKSEETIEENLNYTSGSPQPPNDFHLKRGSGPPRFPLQFQRQNSNEYNIQKFFPDRESGPAPHRSQRLPRKHVTLVKYADEKPLVNRRPMLPPNFNPGRRRSSAVKRDRIMTMLQRGIHTGWFYAYGIVVKNLAKEIQYVSKDRDAVGKRTSPPPAGKGNENSWYQSGMTRELAVEILRREKVGSFIIRDSNTHPGYTVSIKVKDGRQHDDVSHYNLLKTRQGGVVLKDVPSREWPTVKHFIEHLKQGDPFISQHLGLSRYH